METKLLLRLESQSSSPRTSLYGSTDRKASRVRSGGSEATWEQAVQFYTEKHPGSVRRPLF